MGFCKNIMQVATGLKSDKIVCLMNSAGTWQYNPSFTLDFGEIITLIGTYAYGLTVTSNVHEFVRNKHKTEYSADGTNWTTINNGKCFVDARYVRMTNDNGGHDRYIEGMAVGVKKSGGGSLYCKLFKNPFVKGFSACRQSGKRWNLMGFCRNILPGGSKTPFPAGYKFKTGELAKSSSATFSIPSGCIPLTLKVVANGSGSWSDPWITIKDNNDKNIFYLHPGKNNEVNYSIGTPVDLMSLYNWDFDALATVNKFTVSNNKSSWTLSIVAWLEKAGA